jgi:CheY-like chemotaxis protein
MEKHRILVVDDNMDIRFLLKKWLEIEGFEVLTAANGLDAQETLQKEASASSRLCMILLDLMMPIMDGWQFLEWKKQAKEYTELPVLVISAVAPEKKPMEGVVGFLKKPVSLPIMLEYINNHC